MASPAGVCAGIAPQRVLCCQGVSTGIQLVGRP